MSHFGAHFPLHGAVQRLTCASFAIDLPSRVVIQFKGALSAPLRQEPLHSPIPQALLQIVQRKALARAPIRLGLGRSRFSASGWLAFIFLIDPVRSTHLASPSHQAF
jgi:hypothetical protein